MNNGNQRVEKVLIREVLNVILVGEALVNGQTVYFHYNKRDDKFTGSSLSSDDAGRFGLNNKHNWMYLVCGSIAHQIKTGNVTYSVNTSNSGTNLCVL